MSHFLYNLFFHWVIYILYVVLFLQLQIYKTSFLRSAIFLVQLADICCYFDDCTISLTSLLQKTFDRKGKRKKLKKYQGEPGRRCSSQGVKEQR